MAEHVIRLPDVGEGVAEAELVEWHVKVGDLVREDAILAAVMTDKATVEIPSPVDGEIIWLGAEIGDVVAVGSDLVRLKVPGEDADAASAAQPRARIRGRPKRAKPTPAAPEPRRGRRAERAPNGSHVCPDAGSRDAARSAPSRAKPRSAHRAPRAETARLAGGAPARAGGGHRPAAGPGHRSGRPHHPRRPRRIRRSRAARRRGRQALQPKTAVEDVKVIGLRRKIAEKMAAGACAHPAHHLCRRSRCHRARGAARRR